MADIMANVQTLTIIIIMLALVFDFINGFHDAANATATVVATRVLKRWQAVVWAAIFNFMAMFFVSTGVAKTVGSGLIDLSFVTPQVMICGLLAGITWNLMTWWWAMPASSSHTLIGAYAGATFGHVYLTAGNAMQNPFVIDGWLKVLAFIFVAPLVGYVLSYIILRTVRIIHYRYRRHNWRRVYSGCQLLSSALLSFNHGANDAQKTAGIIAGALVVGGYMDQDNFHIPDWVLVAAYTMIALGTLAGGWRITETLGFKLTKLRPVHGFSAETGAAASIAMATYLHMPISTTLATTGSIVGVGRARGHGRVNWSLFKKIGSVWVFTLPVSFTLGAAVFMGADLLGF